MNLWNIPDSIEDEVRVRDKRCVYCGIEMLQKVARGTSRKAVATWEHIINDASIITRENIALCCCACNASKGQRALVDWLQSAYCVKRGVSEDTVAQIVRDALAKARSASNQSLEPTAGRRDATLYEVRPRKDKRGVDLISDALPFGRLWYGEPDATSNAIGYAKHRSRSHHAVIRVYDEAGNVIETHEHAGEFKEW